MTELHGQKDIVDFVILQRLHAASDGQKLTKQLITNSLINLF